MRCAVAAATIALSMTGCASTGGSATEAAICDELRRALPTWAPDDTEMSKAEGALFLDVFAAVCAKP
jgi:hypothetical protein